MLPVSVNNQTCFFSINHITKELSNKLIYGISLNASSYFISKFDGADDCVQLDNNNQLNPAVLKEICAVITEIEKKYKKRLPLELMNSEIFSILGRIRNQPLL